MDALALSPRGRNFHGVSSLSSNTALGSCSPLSHRRHKTGEPQKFSACSNVHWKFLPPARLEHQQHKQLESRIPLLNALDHPQTQADLELEFQRKRRERDVMEQEQQRVLYDLMGETQRKAMLDHVMAQMEVMAISSHQTSKISALQSPSRDGNRSGGGNSVPKDENGEDSSDDELPELKMIRERERQRRISVAITADSYEDKNSHPLHVQWQMSSKVKLASNIPLSIRTSLEGIGCVGDKEQVRNVADQPFDDGTSLRRKSSMPSPTPPLQPHRSSHGSEGSRTKRRVLLETPPEVDITTLLADVVSPKAQRQEQARYGMWYMPQEEWWSLHQAEQNGHDPSQISVSPASFRNMAALKSPAHSHRQVKSTDNVTQREIELQREIPESYIGREYRKYIIAKGAPLPSFLNQ